MTIQRTIEWIRRQNRGLWKIGPRDFIRLKALKYRTYPDDAEPVAFHLAAAEHPVYCRPRSTDGFVFQQIFLEEEYRCLADIPDSGGLILDLGGNVGHSASYLLTRFPSSNVISVEPDPANFELLQRTLAPYGDRARTIHSGVWSHSCGLVVDEDTLREDNECGRQVRPARPGEIPQMQAVDVPTLLNDSGRDRIFLLKVDVEGAEEQIFQPDSAAWIDRVDNIVIEPHGEKRARIFHEAVAGQNFEISTCDELTVCKRR